MVTTVSVQEFDKPSILNYWIAKLDDEMVVTKFDPETDLNADMDYQYGVISKKVGINYAIITAYEKAKLKDQSINLVKSYDGVIVSAIFPYAQSDLKPDDIITQVNGQKFNNVNEFRELVANYSNDEKVSFKVKRLFNKEYIELDVYSNFVEKEDGKYLGISVYDYYTVDGKNSTPKFEITDSYESIGGSGGAMLTLSIYNALLEEDVTKVVIDGTERALRITGTGTIDSFGNIGEIGSVELKVLTAYINKADVFFVCDKNYEDAIKALDKYNIDKDAIKIISVSTFDDIINSLENW